MAGQEDPEIRRFLEGEMQRAQFQAAALELSEVCWKKCIDKPGSKPIGSGTHIFVAHNVDEYETIHFTNVVRRGQDRDHRQTVVRGTYLEDI